jgi:hypothetical protein
LPEQEGPLMQNRSGIDELLTRAIIQEIGETLRAALSKEELTPRLRSQLDRLTQLDDGCSAATAPEPPGENPRTTVAQRLMSRMRRRTQSRQSTG